jgi:class 3 adenylate cyclase/CHASE2 domain-containing sensor protein
LVSRGRDPWREEFDLVRQKAILRPFWRSCAIGLAVSALMVALYTANPRDTIRTFEAWSLDLRFQIANRLLKPSDEIRIVAIDDQTLRQLDPDFGRYPWPRRVFADLVDVLKEAGAARIVLDLHFPEAMRVLQLPAGSPELREPPVQDDQRFAEAIARAGNVYLPVVFPDIVSGRYDLDAVRRIGRQLARQNVVLSDEQFSQRVGLPAALLGRDASLRGRMAYLLRERFWLSDQALAEALGVDVRKVRDWIAPVKRQVALELVDAQVAADPHATVDSIRLALSKGAPPPTLVAADDVAWALDLVQRERIIRPDLLSLPADLSPKDLSVLVQVGNPFQAQLPIAPLARAAHGFGHVVFDRDPDGPVRRLAMLIRWKDRVVPQLALRVATDLLNLQWDKAALRPDKITVPGRTRDGRDAVYTLFLDPTGQTLVNWTMPGKTWQTCFAPVPAGAVLEVAYLSQTIRQNQARLEMAKQKMVDLIQPGERSRYAALNKQEQDLLHQLDPPAAATQHESARSVRDDIERIRREKQKIETACIDMLNLSGPDLPAALAGTTDPAERADLQDRLWLYEDVALGRIARINAELAERSSQRLAQLRTMLAGKIVFIGCTATALEDIVSTPIWSECPGVMAHAQTLNALLQNRSIRPVNEGMNTAIVLACCLLVTVVTAWLGPRQSLIAMAVVCAAFVLFAMYVLFERLSVATALATPAAGMFVTWAMITSYRELVEERAKRHMTRTLQQYTSPALARRMAEDPDAVARAENREITCFISDLQGFTSISERLGAEATQQVLNLYLERMTEALDRHEALLSKFWGDGLFAFFNPAINPQPDHARRACLAALGAQEALAQLRRERQDSEVFQALHMRIGLATGMAVVGNCGSERKFDYTCIGDTVNLASRLESANKAFGTRILVNSRCRASQPDAFEWRHMGRVQVVGRAAFEETYELVGRGGEVDGSTAEYIERFEQAVRWFIAGDLAQAKDGFEECLRQRPDDKAAGFYLEQCEQHLKTGLPEAWNGAVALVEK